MASVLEFRHVSAGYGETVVVEDIDLSLGAGESISIIGRNGVGKTTLLATAMGHTTLHAGDIVFDGNSIARIPPYRRATAGLGFVPQEREIFPSLSVRENLEVGARAGSWTQERVFELFPNLRERLGNMGNQLSGGEQQMLSMARAMSTDPQVLLLDELSMGLAPLVVEALYEVVRTIAAEGLSILIVEQFAHEVLGVASSASIMLNGHIEMTGSPTEVNAALASAYLGGTVSE